MRITLNGIDRDTGVRTLSELVAEVSDRNTGIAVAVNSEVVPRSSWSSTPVAEGDRIDVVTAVQGG